VLKRLTYRVHAALEHYLPEQRLYLKSETTTRFVRLRPLTQAVAIAGGTMLIAWAIVATAIIAMEELTSSDAAQVERQQAEFEGRLTALSADRDLRADEAVRAQDRFNLALAEVSAMQGRLLASEEARKELEKGIEVIQDTLRRVMDERDAARTEVAALEATLERETGSTRSAEATARDAADTIAIMTDTLAGTAAERDAMAGAALAAQETIEAVEAEKRAILAKNDLIFAKLEEAVTVSMEPLDKMFTAAGLSTEDLISAVKSGYSGQGGPLGPFTISTSNAALSPDEVRANSILSGLDRMNLYRIAAEKTPFAMPVKSAFRFTSGFGFRRDPKGAGTRMHEGTDFAGSTGTPIYATGDGVVVHAGWDSGYGRSVEIQHEFGILTRYAHLSQIRVSVGERVSRGDRIGDMGSSGRSTGTHLHYEVRIGGRAANPMTFIKAGSNVF
jgi:murein DD-endopeptidase MepM/ murein hydrolase activator NlpD